jgi:hypothetical protein
MMKPSEKTLADLARALESRSGSAGDDVQSASLVERHLGFLPPSTRQEILIAYREKKLADPGRADLWLLAATSVFLKEYDGTALSTGEWREIRDIVSAEAGVLHMDVVSYALGLVMEYKAL